VEKVEYIAIKYDVPENHPNLNLHGTFSRAAINDICGFGQKFSRDEVYYSLQN
jgi:hypothetical protein